MKTLRFLPALIAALTLAIPIPLYAQQLSQPRIALPTEIDAAGTTTRTLNANTCRGFSVSPQSSTAQLRVTVSGANYDFALGYGWTMNSPDTQRFGNAVTLTALAGKFTISTIQ